MKSRIININCKSIEFDRFRNQAGLRSYKISVKNEEKPNAIGFGKRRVDERKLFTLEWELRG